MCNIGVGGVELYKIPKFYQLFFEYSLEFPIFCGMYCEVRHRIGSVTNGSLAGLFHLLSRLPSFKAFTL
jgi:hypothetical protein